MVRAFQLALNLCTRSQLLHLCFSEQWKREQGREEEGVRVAGVCVAFPSIQRGANGMPYLTNHATNFTGGREGKAKQLFIYGKRNLLKSVEIKTNFIIYLFRYHFVCNAHTHTHTKRKRERQGGE